MLMVLQFQVKSTIVDKLLQMSQQFVLSLYEASTENVTSQ